jgi:nitrogen regulatory protein PII
MKSERVSLVVIVAREEMGETLLTHLRKLGAKGFTTTLACGFGRHGKRPANFLDTKNLRIETLVSSEIADKILEELSKAIEDQVLVAYRLPVDAIPSGKFT